MYGGDLVVLSCACGILCNISCNNSYKKLDVIGLDGIPTIVNTIIGKIIIFFLTFVCDNCKNLRERYYNVTKRRSSNASSWRSKKYNL